MELIISEWAKMETTLPIFDKNAEFERWEDGGSKYAGMRRAGESNGIVRIVASYGDIFIGSYKADREHGLRIIWSGGSVSVYLFKEGKELSCFWFKPLNSFEEIKSGW